MLFLLVLYWMILGQCRYCNAMVEPYRCDNDTFMQFQTYSPRRICDGSPDCEDGLDESPAICCPSTCPSDPDICIQAWDRLLHGENCRDCSPGYNEGPGWRCNSGQCLKKEDVCDGKPQCPDGSDESPATCCPSTCPSDPDICIKAGDELQPGQDCRDCTYISPYVSSSSHHDFFNFELPGWRCNSGQCVIKSNVCDNSGYHCPDGSDESPATCCTSTCPSDPNICIPAGQEVLPGQDCRDCTTEYYGPGWRCNGGQCLSKSQVCDGSPECPDGSDESPATCCPSTCPSDPDICIPVGKEILPLEDCRACNRSEGEVGLGWRCNSGQCMLKSQVCDGVPQCSDGSDETFGCLVEAAWWTSRTSWWEKLITKFSW